jgi:aminoglycoside phosphotransferase (APT) family kinase protein
MAFMVLETVEGETIARKILRDDEYAAARPRLVGDLGVALARIHALDATAIPGLQHTDQLEYYTGVLDDLAQPHPVLELVRNWLVDTRPEQGARTLVHGDFRLGNLIVGADGLRAVIDWELAHLGDPMEDLGWLCVKAWRFGAAPPVAGLGEYDELFTAYESAGGVAVDPVVVHWWEVLGTWKWAIMCIVQASVHLSGAARSHELAAIGRRVCENEHDLFLALDGHW